MYYHKYSFIGHEKILILVWIDCNYLNRTLEKSTKDDIDYDDKNNDEENYQQKLSYLNDY